MKEKIIFNGKVIEAGTPVVSSESRGLRFGDGCFETMKVVDGNINLAALHFERLFSSLDRLGFELLKHFTSDVLQEQILSLVKKNGHQQHARVRLTVFRGNGGLYDAENDFPNYVIESWGLENTIGEFNANGLVLDVFKDARKSCDQFSHIKSNNFLPYVLAANWAKKQQLNDAILLNSFNRVADTTIANLFIVTNGVIKTPSLQEGCIGGVMRRYLIDCFRQENIPLEESPVTVDELSNASEVFLTNAIRGIKWVKQVGENHYTFQVSEFLSNKFVKPLNHS